MVACGGSGQVVRFGWANEGEALALLDLSFDFARFRPGADNARHRIHIGDGDGVKAKHGGTADVILRVGAPVRKVKLEVIESSANPMASSIFTFCSYLESACREM